MIMRRPRYSLSPKGLEVISIEGVKTQEDKQSPPESINTQRKESGYALDEVA